MDTLAPHTGQRRTTRAAEGLDRWRWTRDELVALQAAGAFSGEDGFELFDGEIVPMGSDGRRHATLSDVIIEQWVIRDPLRLRVGEQKQLNLDEATFTKPDVLVWPTGQNVYDLRGPDVLLLVEIADSSLAKDLGIKRDLYARFGIREYWVIDATALTTRVHKQPSDGVYRTVTDHAGADVLMPDLAPHLVLRLADLAASL
jgi:Uma2 family endonuclease